MLILAQEKDEINSAQFRLADCSKEGMVATDIAFVNASSDFDATDASSGFLNRSAWPPVGSNLQIKTFIRERNRVMVADETRKDRVVNDLKKVVRDSEELLADAAGVVGEKAQEMRDRLARTPESAKEAYHRLEIEAKTSA